MKFIRKKRKEKCVCVCVPVLQKKIANILPSGKKL